MTGRRLTVALLLVAGLLVVPSAAAQGRDPGRDPAADPNQAPAVDPLTGLPAYPGATANPDPRPRATGVDPVRVTWPDGDYTVGDRVPVTLTVVLPEAMLAGDGPQAAPRFPTWQDTWGEAEVVEAGEVERVDPDEPAVPAGTADAADGTASAGAPGPRRAWRQRLTLAAYRTGRVALPPREILVPGADGRSRRLTTPPDLALEIVSVLPAPQADGAAGAPEEAPIPEPMAAKPMRELPVGTAFWWTAGVLSLLLLGLVLLHQRRRLAEALGTGGRATLPPAAELRRALAAAREEASAGEGLVRVSTALRRYLGRRLAFPALESTTTEIRRALAQRERSRRDPAGPAHLTARLPGDLASRCGEILAACDLVKFARRPAVAADVGRWADAAEGVADDLEAALRPQEEAEAEAAQGGGADGSGRREAAA